MFRKIAVVFVLVCILLSLSSCLPGGGKGTLDEQSGRSFMRIEDCLPNAERYFAVAEASVVLKDVENKADCLDAFVESAKPKDDLPKELVDGYVDSFVAYFSGEEGASAEELEREAAALIKREMVISIEAERFNCSKISADEAKAKAKELAELYGAELSDFYTEEATDESGALSGGGNYVVKSAILEERVKACLEGVWNSLH